jgi:hypothetical protein
MESTGIGGQNAPFKGTTEYREMGKLNTVAQQNTTPPKPSLRPQNYTQNYTSLSAIDIPKHASTTEDNSSNCNKAMRSMATQEGKAKMVDKSNETVDILTNQDIAPIQFPHTQILKKKQKVGMFLPSQYEDEKIAYRKKLINYQKSIEQTAKIQELSKKVQK